MGEPEKAYNLAKRRYVQEVGLLRKEIDDSDKKKAKRTTSPETQN